MNLAELKKAVDWAVNSCERTHRDAEKITVYIPSFKVGSAGHRPCTGVKHAGMGIDWESSSFLIAPEHDLREIDRDEIAILLKKYDELSWSHYKVSKVKRENEQLKEQIAKLKGTKDE